MEFAFALLVTLCAPQSPAVCQTIRHEFPIHTPAKTCEAWGEDIKALLAKTRFPKGERGAIVCQNEDRL